MLIMLSLLRTICVLCAVQIGNVLSDAATDYNKVNNDGSFSFGLSNNDIGGHYHEATGSVDKIVRGRYGARSPASGRVEETIYTAGPRGFRARGPRIHRKMDLSQYPRGPIGAPGDPLSDPFDDPSYSFGFRTPEHERQEDADSTGRVGGLYSYLDDVGERHTVRYAAGAGTGFEVINAVPDSPANVAYNAPLYKAPKGTRGRMATVRGPDGQYSFILSAPDHRRSESSDPDGVVRGSYSYLDDKGIQRTVQYVAGAGIGYRVVQSTTGAGTHLASRPAIPAIDIRDEQSNNLADDGYLKTSESGRFRPKDRDGDFNDNRGNKYNDYANRDSFAQKSKHNDGSYDRGDVFESSTKGDRGYESGTQGDRNDSGSSKEGGVWRPVQNDNYHGDRAKPVEGNKPNGYDYAQGSLNSDSKYGDKTGLSPDRGSSFNNRGNNDRYDDSYNFNRKSGSGTQKDSKNQYSGSGEHSSNRNKVKGDSNSGDQPEYYNSKEHQTFPVITVNRAKLQSDRDGDWITLGRDSTIIKNVGKWYVGLPPGTSVRAHVQNIDLLPLGGRQPSRSDALRRNDSNLP